MLMSKTAASIEASLANSNAGSSQSRWTDDDGAEFHQHVFDHHHDAHLVFDDEHLAAFHALRSHQSLARTGGRNSPTSDVNGRPMVQTTPVSAKLRSTFAFHS
jgi:hypothetical protein